MDEIVERFAFADGDLVVSLEHGVAYQRGRGRIVYGDEYLGKFAAYDERIRAAVNAGRCALVARHLSAGARLLDVGAGDGAFVRAARQGGFEALGFEVIPAAAAALRREGRYAEDLAAFDAVTLWDAIEHMEDPGACLRGVRAGALVFASLPIFADLRTVRTSKHYRPGEHLYYFTDAGFVAWAARCGLRLLERSAHEIEAGRESIGAYAFCKDLVAGRADRGRLGRRAGALAGDFLTAWLQSWWQQDDAWRAEQRKLYGSDTAHLLRGVADMIEACLGAVGATELEGLCAPPCHCGGEVQLEYFDHPRRTREWFMRCRACGGIGPTGPTPEDAQALWDGRGRSTEAAA